MKQTGIYYWAGPGTIRMIQLKFPGARINAQNLMQSYDYHLIKQAKQRLEITDAWVSYSWGFSPQTEQGDYEFTRRKLRNFQSLGIKTHGYIQGCNLVLSENNDQDYYCRDWYGRLIPYHRGRKMTCPNNPNFQRYIFQKITQALTEAFDGIFIDNINFGQFPLIIGNKTTFFGCNCKYCQRIFRKKYGFIIPKTFTIGTEIFEAYIRFRTASLMQFVGKLSRQVRARGKLFGTNSFDPKYDTQLFYGTDLEKLTRLQDYLLFENHDLPREKRNNAHIAQLQKKLPLPVFVVSYKNGIGRESVYSQQELNAIYTESTKLGYAPCYKATEYITRKVWHNLDFRKFTPPTLMSNLRFDELPKVTRQLRGMKFLPLYNRLYNTIMTLQFERMFARKTLGWLYYRGIT